MKVHFMFIHTEDICDPHFDPVLIEVEGPTIKDSLEDILNQMFKDMYGDIPDGQYINELIRDTPVHYSESGRSAIVNFEASMYIINEV